MLKPVFEKLDQWITERNTEARRQSFRPIKACTFQVVGQSALLEAILKIEIAATVDVDVLHDAEFSVISKLDQLLRVEGLEYDPLSNEIWMPVETEYLDIYRGVWVTALLAKPEFIMLSKAKYAVRKNRSLLREYIAFEASEEFFSLCEKYQIDMQSILSDS